jgi:hypothetical protein
MVLIGFLVLAAAAAIGIEVAVENFFAIDLDAFNQTFSTSVSAVFIAGVVTGLAGAVGVLVLRDGLVRRHRLRLEAMEADAIRERHIAELEEEHAAMRRNDVGLDGDEGIDLRERDRERAQEHLTTF